MAIKTILVCLTSHAHADPLMKAAVNLARAHDAHLIGLYTLETLLVYPTVAVHLNEGHIAAFNKGQQEQADRIEKIFRKHTENEDFASEWRVVKTDTLSPADRMIDSARAGDIVLMAQADADNDSINQTHNLERLIKESGRPVMIVPLDYDGADIGKNILLGWSATREATRAAHDLMNLTTKNTKIGVLRVGAIDKDELADHASLELAECYARHGLAATIIHRDKTAEGIVDIIKQEALEQGADLIATGAFGHSRAYDLVIGAATRDLMRRSTVPVMFSK